MISITDCCRQIISKNPFLSESLALGLLNTSEYARTIQNEIEKITFKPVKIQTIVTSLNRLKIEQTKNLPPKFVVEDVQLKYPITNLAYDLKLNKTKKVGEIYGLFAGLDDPFLNVIVGNHQINILVNSKYATLAKDLLKGQKPTLEMEDLAAISLKFDKKYLQIPGSLYLVLRTLFLENINLIEAVSTYTEITLFVYKKDSQKILEIMNREFIG